MWRDFVLPDDVEYEAIGDHFTSVQHEERDKSSRHTPAQRDGLTVGDQFDGPQRASHEHAAILALSSNLSYEQARLRCELQELCKQ
jgi:hypothetical protein